MSILARLEASVGRVASEPYADAAEARALLALIRGEK